jgi:hypothetical protein
MDLLTLCPNILLSTKSTYFVFVLSFPTLILLWQCGALTNFQPGKALNSVHVKMGLSCFCSKPTICTLFAQVITGATHTLIRVSQKMLMHVKLVLAGGN